MKASIFQFRKHSFFSLLLALCIGFGLACPLHLLLGLTPRPMLVFLVTLSVSGAFFLFKSIRPLRFFSFPLVILCILFQILPYRKDFLSFWNALILAISGDFTPLAVWSYPLTIFLSFMITVLGNAISQSETPFFSVLLLLILLFFPVALGNTGLSVLWLIPLIFALLLSTRESNTRYSATIISSAAVLVLTFFLFPLLPKSQPALEERAQAVRKVLDDYLFFTDARTPFSLAGTGWQPLGTNRLGGTVNPTEDKVMQVMVSTPVLLRGTVRNVYTGFAWTDTIGSRRYLYVDPRFASLRKNLFDTDRPPQSLLSALPQPELIRVYMEEDATSTLYLTQRFTRLSGPNIVPYFSPASEIFATHSLAAGDQYSFYGIPLSSETEGIRNVVLSAGTLSDPWMEETIRAEYLSLPDSVETAVYSLAGTITQNARTDFDRVLALSTFLSTYYEYSLTQDNPPTTRDYVSWFLFEEKRGYCTAFASSLAVMARILGIPARYVEGYSVYPDSDGIAYVTQKNAHAWCEVYFSGFGWLAFDSTPGRNNDNNDNPDNPENPENPDDPSSWPTPTPQATPTPTPSPEPSAMQSPTPDPDSSETPTPEPTATPTPPVTPTPTPEAPEKDNRNSGIFVFLLILLLLLLLAACISLRISMTTPAYVAGRQQKRSNALLIYYAAILQILETMNITPAPGEAPATFLVRVSSLLPEPVDLSGLGTALCTAGYSNRRPSKQQMYETQQTYEKLVSLLNPLQRLRLIAKRLVHGLSLKTLA